MYPITITRVAKVKFLIFSDFSETCIRSAKGDITRELKQFFTALIIFSIPVVLLFHWHTKIVLSFQEKYSSMSSANSHSTIDVTTIAGSASTAQAAQFTVSFDKDFNAKNKIADATASSVHVFVSHGDNYTLWQEGSKASHSLTKFLMSGSTKSFSRDLSDAFDRGFVGDYVIAHDHSPDDTNDKKKKIEENLIVTSAHPFISLASYFEASPRIFSGVSKVTACAPSALSTEGEVLDNSTNNEDPWWCEYWFDSITAPLYLYEARAEGLKMSNYSDSTTTEYETNSKQKEEQLFVLKDSFPGIIQRVNQAGGIEKIVPVGFVTFGRVLEADEITVGKIIKGHVKLTHRPVFVSVVTFSVLGLILVAGIFRMWKSRRDNGYRQVE